MAWWELARVEGRSLHHPSRSPPSTLPTPQWPSLLHPAHPGFRGSSPLPARLPHLTRGPVPADAHLSDSAHDCSQGKRVLRYTGR